MMMGDGTNNSQKETMEEIIRVKQSLKLREIQKEERAEELRWQEGDRA
jgi:hypothetical protein